MDAQLGQRNWPHTGCHARAALDAPVSVRDASGGDSDCRVSRCLEQDGSQGDLERKEELGDDVVFAVALQILITFIKVDLFILTKLNDFN